MGPIEWARNRKLDFMRLQQEHGIPALFGASQHVHEAFNSDGSMSELAANAQNFCGLKWAEWERQYGCFPVTYGTWEVINGQRVDLEDAFCGCPSFDVWLSVYTDLITTSSRYKPALAYGYDPLLFGYHIWRGGWATDPTYIVGIAKWMTTLWDDYADTLKPQRFPVQVLKDENEYAAGDFWEENGRPVGRIRPVLDLLAQLGYGWHYNNLKRVLTIDSPPKPDALPR